MYLQGKESVFDLVWTEWTNTARRAAHLPRRLPPERGRAVDVQLRAVERAEAVRAVRVLRVRGEAPARGEAAAARLRDDPQGRAHVQPARRARRDLGDRARRVHRAHPRRCRGWSRRRTSIRARRSAFRCCPTRFSGARRHERRARRSSSSCFTEELPPKALKRLGEAFAEGIAAGLESAAISIATSAVDSVRDAAPARGRDHATCAHVAPDSRVIDKLMPAKVASTPSGKPTEALQKKLAGLGARPRRRDAVDASTGPISVYVESDGKADYVYLRSVAKGQPLRARPAGGARRRDRASCRSRR